MKYAMPAAVAMVVAIALLTGGVGKVAPATAQGDPFTAPTGVVVRDDATPGDVVISWEALETANYYRIGWVAYPDYEEISLTGGRPWQEAFAFVDVENIGQTSRTVRRLTPGVMYAFQVGSKSGEDGGATPGEWVLFTVQADTTACPAVEGPGTGTTTPEPTQPATGGDYDADDDGLIEISNIDQLDAIRYDLDGDGVSEDDAYAAAFPGAASDMGCPGGGCIGYELATDLDFGSAFSAQGWEPIGYLNSEDDYAGFNAFFEGNDHTISNLYIGRGDTDYVGLFGFVDSDGNIRQVRLVSASVTVPLAAWSASILALSPPATPPARRPRPAATSAAWSGGMKGTSPPAMPLVQSCRPGDMLGAWLGGTTAQSLPATPLAA